MGEGLEMEESVVDLGGRKTGSGVGIGEQEKRNVRAAGRRGGQRSEGRMLAVS